MSYSTLAFSLQLYEAVKEHQDSVAIDFAYRPQLDVPADELVLEAAVNGMADIVTFNEKHFKPAKKFNVQVLTPSKVLEQIARRRISRGSL